jgi:prephenate dehydrogenase
MSFLFLSLCSDQSTPFAETTSLAGTTFNRQMDVARFVAAQPAALYHDIQRLNEFSEDLFDTAMKSIADLRTMFLKESGESFAEFMKKMRERIGF